MKQQKRIEATNHLNTQQLVGLEWENGLYK